MGAAYSSSTRQPNGLYQVYVKVGNGGGQDQKVDGLMVRFETPGATIEELKDVDIKPGEKPKDFTTIAKYLRSPMMAMMSGLVLEVEKDGKVKAVYIKDAPDNKKNPDLNTHKLVLGLLRLMYMTHREVVDILNLNFKSIDEYNKMKDKEQLMFIANKIYTPEFRLPFDIPDGTTNVSELTGSRMEYLALYEPKEIPKEPVVPGRGGGMLKLIGFILIIAIIAYVLYTRMKQ